MGKWAIVAIPEKDDPVWKISSETIPHLTILYLGEHEDSELEAPVLSYLEHATNTVLHRFGLSVEKRGTLGPKEADVVFFEKAWLPTELEVFRSSLLKDPTILGFFNNSDQYKEWTPHLTLGFPDTPAKPDDREYPGIHHVGFDKVALWTGDYEGPTFELKSWSTIMEDVVHASSTRDRALSALAEKGVSLAHRFEFKEDMVKRDKGGKFSKKAERNPEDAYWLDEEVLSAIEEDIQEAVGGKVGKIFQDTLDEMNLTADKMTPEDINKVRDAVLPKITKLANDAADKLGVSPSGKNKLAFVPNKKGTDLIRKVVPRSGPKPTTVHPAVTKAQNAWKKTRAPKSLVVDKPLFNPTADISINADTHLTDIGEGDENPFEAPMWKRIRDALMHGEEFVEDDHGFTHKVEFNEASVKRDKGGKFSTKNEVNDTAWLNKIKEKLLTEVMTGQGYIDLLNGIAKKHDMPKTATVAEVQMKPEYMPGLLELVEKTAEKHGTSPSGQFKVVYTPKDGAVLEPTKSVKHAGMTVSDFVASIQDITPEDAVQFGVIGMRWGVRRARGPGGRVESSADAKEIVDIKRKIAGGGLDVLSNAELQKLNTRLNLENSYSKALSDKGVHSKIKKGLDLGKTVNRAIDFATSPAGHLVVATAKGQNKGKSKLQALMDAKALANPKKDKDDKKNDD